MIQTFVKKPIVIEAIQFLGDNAEECKHFILPNKGECFTNSDGTVTLYIYCDRDVLSVLVGDWITKEDGEMFVITSETFEKNHVALDEETAKTIKDVKGLQYIVVDNKVVVLYENGLLRESSLDKEEQFDEKI